MTIGNARAFIDGRFTACSVSFDEGVITDIGAPGAPCDIDAQGNFLTPGFIDIHTHGAMGADASDGDPAGLLVMGRHHARHGVTSFLPTTMTLPEPELTRAMQTVRDYVRPADGAKIAGVHLEGPFLSYQKRGAQNPDNLQKPDFEMLCRLNEASGGNVRLVTVAPEQPGGIDFIRQAAQLCTVAIGHTTADYETAMAAYRAGASGTTHLFNAMPPLNHRQPGVIGAALASGAYVELICDGVHVHESVIYAVHRMFGSKLVIVSDSLRSAGMPDGQYQLGGQPIVVKDGKATLLDGTIAGSSSNLLEEVKIAVAGGVPLEAALTAVTAAPAKAVRLDGKTGSIAVGKSADLLLLDPELNLCFSFIDGHKIS